jgi:uncharacterized protein YdaT
MLVFFPTTMLKSDSDNEVNAVDDDDLEQEKAAPAQNGKGPTKAATTSKRRNVQPAESAGLSPDRKMRKTS